MPNNTFGDISFAFMDVDLVESYRGCFTAMIEYVAEKYNIASCRNIALLIWN